MSSPTFWKSPPPLGFTIDCKTRGKVIMKLNICWSSNIGGRGLLHTCRLKREIHRYKLPSKCISELFHSVFKSTLKIPCHHYMKDCLPIWFSLHLIMHNMTYVDNLIVAYHHAFKVEMTIQETSMRYNWCETMNYHSLLASYLKIWNPPCILVHDYKFISYVLVLKLKPYCPSKRISSL
jgi:hypothetical protein